MRHYAIIVAGGKGSRMNKNVPKQFLELDGKPVMMYTIEAFHRCVPRPEIIVVLNEEQHQFWEVLCMANDFNIQHEVVAGGETRFDSVKNGLQSISSEGVVAIHDAVRPLVSPDLIQASYQMAITKGNAIAAVPSVDSVRMVQSEGVSVALNRDHLYLVQTPQTFMISQLNTAYQQDFTKDFTDDASVVEKAGFEINILPGERKNIKITYPIDMAHAFFLMKVKGF